METERFLSVIMAALIISVTILASTPPVSKAAFVHHLAMPKRIHSVFARLVTWLMFGDLIGRSNAKYAIFE